MVSRNAAAGRAAARSAKRCSRSRAAAERASEHGRGRQDEPPAAPHGALHHDESRGRPRVPGVAAARARHVRGRGRGRAAAAAAAPPPPPARRSPPAPKSGRASSPTKAPSRKGEAARAPKRRKKSGAASESGALEENANLELEPTAYAGVESAPAARKFRATLPARGGGKGQVLGWYATSLEAAASHDEAARLKGRRTNFAARRPDGDELPLFGRPPEPKRPPRAPWYERLIAERVSSSPRRPPKKPAPPPPAADASDDDDRRRRRRLAPRAGASTPPHVRAADADGWCVLGFGCGKIIKNLVVYTFISRFYFRRQIF